MTRDSTLICFLKVDSTGDKLSSVLTKEIRALVNIKGDDPRIEAVVCDLLFVCCRRVNEWLSEENKKLEPRFREMFNALSKDGVESLKGIIALERRELWVRVLLRCRCFSIASLAAGARVQGQERSGHQTRRSACRVQLGQTHS